MKKSTTKPASIPPPSDLSPAAKTWWRRLHAEFDLSDTGALFLLESALKSHDRMVQAGKLVDEFGPATKDRYGQLKSNPACAAERDARAAMLSAFRQLNLDVLPPMKVGRPSGK